MNNHIVIHTYPLGEVSGRATFGIIYSAHRQSQLNALGI